MKRKTLLVMLPIILMLIFLIIINLDADAPGVDNFVTLNVGVDPSLPPFQFENNGRLFGLNIDILNAIALENSIKINYIPMNKDISISKLLNGEIDLILGVRYDAALSGQIDYTESVVQSVVCMLVKSEIHKDIQANLNSSSYLASVENNSVELNFLHNLRRVNYNVAFNQEDAFQLLLIDRADFLLGVKDTEEYLLNKYNLSSEYVIIDSYMTPVEYLIAVKPENKKLLNLINYGLSRLKLNGQYEKLYYKWVENGEANIARRLEYVIGLSLIGAVVVCIVFLIVATWNIKLKEQVNLKTKELSKINLDLEAQIIETKNNIELKNFICESSPRGIAIFDLNGIISIFNNSALQMASLTTPPIEKSIYDIEPMNLMLKGTINKVLKYKTAYTCDEFKYRKGDKELAYRYVMYPLHDYENKLRGAIITIEDITEEKRIKNQIHERDKNRALTQIIAGISHEIRNPLTTIKTFIELIPTKIDNKKFKEEIAIVVPEEINRVDNLIESLIDYAKPKSQNEATINLGEIVNSCVALFKPVLEQNDIDININTNTELFIYCDKSQIKQAIINFILNSIDAIIEKKKSPTYLDYQGKISIEGYTREDAIILIIEDNGIGMNNLELEKAYDMFYTTKEKGTGIGIPLSIQMLNMNNCKVSIKSQKNELTAITLSFSK
ncbi:MAG: transporter substrate-binding domain-containing protein [Clostridia bacterium]